MSIVLAAAIALFAIVIVRREFGKARIASSDAAIVSDLSRPVFVADWKSLVSSGTTFGESTAPIQVIEFADLQCPSCRDMQLVLGNMKQEFGKKLAVTFVHYPLSYHLQALPAARAAECANAQGRMESFLAQAYAQQQVLGKTPWEDLAQKSGVGDMEAFSSCIRDTTEIASVTRGLYAGTAADISGTPTLIVNGWKFQRSPGDEMLKKFIRALLSGEYPATPLTLAPVAHAVRHDADIGLVTFDTADYARAPQFGLAAQRIAVIGTKDETDLAFDLTGVEGAVFLRNGNLVAYASVGPKVLAFDSIGKPLASLVRVGAGPGEVRRVSNIARSQGDTVVLADFANQRVNWYVSDKGFLRDLKIQNVAANSEYLAGVLPTGDLVLYNGGTLPEQTGNDYVQQRSALLLLDTTGSTHALTELPDAYIQFLEAKFPNRRPVMQPLPLRMGPKAYVAVWDSLIATGNGDEYRIDLRDRRGKIVSAIEVNAQKQPVTELMRAADLDVRLEALNRQGKPSLESLRLRREWPVADSVAHFGGLFVSPDQTLWVLSALVPGADTWYATAFNTRHEMVGRLSHSGPGVPIAFGDGRVAVRNVNEDGLVSIVIYRIVPRVLGKPIIN